MTTPANLYAAKSTEDHRGSIPTELADHRALAERDGWTAGETSAGLRWRGASPAGARMRPNGASEVSDADPRTAGAGAPWVGTDAGSPPPNHAGSNRETARGTRPNCERPWPTLADAQSAAQTCEET